MKVRTPGISRGLNFNLHETLLSNLGKLNDYLEKGEGHTLSLRQTAKREKQGLFEWLSKDRVLSDLLDCYHVVSDSIEVCQEEVFDKSRHTLTERRSYLFAMYFLLGEEGYTRNVVAIRVGYSDTTGWQPEKAVQAHCSSNDNATAVMSFIKNGGERPASVLMVRDFQQETN